MDNKTLSGLPFKDLYIRINDNNANENSGDFVNRDVDSRYNPLMDKEYDGYSCYYVPQEYKNDLNDLRIKLSKSEREDFAVEHDGVRMRVCRYRTVGRINHEMWCAIRRFNSKLPDINNLNLQAEHLEGLKSLGRRHGLIMFIGGTGAGKTTSSVALLRYYMDNIGGVVYTAEEPVEYYMHGNYSDKVLVIQREIEKEADWAKVIAQGLRSNPKFVFVGEVRNPRAASQMIRIATSGHLVVCTFHGGSISQGISGLIQVAKGDPEIGAMAPYLLAECLICVCYQRIVRGTIEMQQLIIGNEQDRVREFIRSNDMKMIAGEIENRMNLAGHTLRQQNETKNGGANNPSNPNTRKPVGGQNVSAKKPKKKGWFQ